jgi:uncharacterized protein (TIGR02145 family)
LIFGKLNFAKEFDWESLKLADMKTKNRVWLCPLVVMGLVSILTHSCKKDEEPADKITDKDGNVYTSVTIGTQTWMDENLKTTKYNDGTAIPNVTDNTEWSALTTGAYCWLDNNASTYKATYGALYNWYTVSTTINGGKNVCPMGWHVPTDAEWTTLTDYLGGVGAAADKLKEAGTTHWTSPNTGGNETGFTALPGGNRVNSGQFSNVGFEGAWWSATEYDTRYARYREIYERNVHSGWYDKRAGMSVRCVKDN